MGFQDAQNSYVSIGWRYCMDEALLIPGTLLAVVYAGEL